MGAIEAAAGRRRGRERPAPGASRAGCALRLAAAFLSLAAIATVFAGILVTDPRWNRDEWSKVDQEFGYGAFGCDDPAPLGVRIDNRSGRHLVGITVHLRAGHPEQWYRGVGRIALPPVPPGGSAVRCFPAPPLPEGIEAEGSRWTGAFGSTLLPSWAARLLGAGDDT